MMPPHRDAPGVEDKKLQAILDHFFAEVERLHRAYDEEIQSILKEINEAKIAALKQQLGI